MILLFFIEYRDNIHRWIYVKSMNYFMLEEIVQILDSWNPRNVSKIRAIKIANIWST